MRKDFTDTLALQAFGPDAVKNLTEGNCPKCGKNALQNCYSDAGRRETKISGICEICFDLMFGGSEE
jgi:hypothetical protein